MLTKKELSRYYYLSLEIKDLEERKKMLEQTSIGSAKLSGMPKAKYNNTSPTERIIELIDEIDKRLNNRKVEAMQEMIKIEKFISEIDDIETRLIFSKRYIELKGWEKIGEEMHMSKRTAQRIHKKFLEGTN